MLISLNQLLLLQQKMNSAFLAKFQMKAIDLQIQQELLVFTNMSKFANYTKVFKYWSVKKTIELPKLETAWSTTFFYATALAAHFVSESTFNLTELPRLADADALFSGLVYCNERLVDLTVTNQLWLTNWISIGLFFSFKIAEIADNLTIFLEKQFQGSYFC